MTECRKKADEFLKEFYASSDDEAYMLSVVEEADSLKNELGGELPAGLGFTEDVRGRLISLELMRRVMDSICGALSESEKQVMQGVYRDRLSADQIAADLDRERSEIYRIKNRMLDRIGRLLGG